MRRSLLLALPAAAICAPTAEAAPIRGDAGLVDAFSEARQRRLHPRGFPFTAVYRRGARTLGFVAAAHATDPASPTFGEITAAFARVKPRGAVLEGFPTAWGVNPARIVADARATSGPANSWRRGEAVHAARMALRSRTPFIGGEPTDAELLARLTGMGFDADDVFFAALLGPLEQDFKAGAFTNAADARFRAAYVDWARVIAADTGRSAPDYAAFASWYAREYGAAIETDRAWTVRGAPGSAGVAAAIGRANNLLRDRHLLSLMIAELNARGTVLVVFGGSHLSSLARALQAALGQPRFLALG